MSLTEPYPRQGGSLQCRHGLRSRPAPCAARSPGAPPRRSGPRSSRSTSASSASTTTTSSCSGASSRAGAPRGATRRARAARRQRRAVRRVYANVAPSLPGPGRCAAPPPGWPSTSRPGPGRSCSTAASGATSRALGQRARVRAGDLAAPAVRRRAGRARAAAEPARGRAGADRRGGGRLQRPRLGRAPGAPTGPMSRVPDHRRVGGFAGGHLAAPLPRRRATRSSTVAVARPGVDLLDAAAARRGRATRGPTSSTTSPRAPTSASRGATRRHLRDNVAMTLNVLEAVRAEAPGGDGGGGRLRRGLRPARARCPSTRRRRCARRTRTRSRRRRPTCWPASTPTRTACA